MQRLPRYKGKVMTEKQFKRRQSQIESGKRRKKEPIQSDENEKYECIVEGRRIVELKVMAQNLYCSFFEEILSLDNTEKEIRKGLASVLTVRCIKCSVVYLQWFLWICITIILKDYKIPSYCMQIEEIQVATFEKFPHANCAVHCTI